MPKTIELRGLFAGMPGMIEDDQGDGKPWYSGFAKAPLSGRMQFMRITLRATARPIAAFSVVRKMQWREA